MAKPLSSDKFKQSWHLDKRGPFIVTSATYAHYRILDSFKTRWEARGFIKGIKHFMDDFDKSREVVLKHDLAKIEDIEAKMTQEGGQAVQEYYALNYHIFLWLDGILKLLERMPDTRLYQKYLKRLEERYIEAAKDMPKEQKRQYDELARGIAKARKQIVHYREELLKQGEAQLNRAYHKMLPLIKAVEEKDRATFMQMVIDHWKTESPGIFRYLQIRWDVKKVLKDYSKLEHMRKEVAKEIKQLRNLVEGKEQKVLTAEDVVKFVNAINTHQENMVNIVKDAFIQSSDAVVRCAVITFGLIRYLNQLYADQEKLAKQHDIPRAMADEMEKRITEILQGARDAVKQEATEEINAVDARLRKVA